MNKARWRRRRLLQLERLGPQGQHAHAWAGAHHPLELVLGAVHAAHFALPVEHRLHEAAICRAGLVHDVAHPLLLVHVAEDAERLAGAVEAGLRAAALHLALPHPGAQAAQLRSQGAGSEGAQGSTLEESSKTADTALNGRTERRRRPEALRLRVAPATLRPWSAKGVKNSGLTVQDSSQTVS